MEKSRIAADICLYGTQQTGAGYIACRLDGGQTTGSGQPVLGRGFTEAVWLAAEALRVLGVEVGLCRVFAPGGERMAMVDLGRPIPSFGDLTWGPAVFWAIPVQNLLARGSS